MSLTSSLTGKLIKVWGRNATVGTGWEDVYQYDQPMDWYTVLTSSGSRLDVTSTSTSDAAAGTGARKVTVFGLGVDRKFFTETVTLNGNTIVTTVGSFVDVFGADVTETGTGLVNAGDIHIVKIGTGGTYTTGAPGTLTSAMVRIFTGWQTSMNGHFRVPEGGGYYQLMDVCVSAYTQAAVIGITTRDVLSTTDSGHHLGCVFGIGNQSFFQADTESAGIVIGPNQSIHLRALGATASAVVQGSFLLRKAQ